MRANTVNEQGQMYTHLKCNTHLKDCEASVKPIEVTLSLRHYLGSEKSWCRCLLERFGLTMCQVFNRKFCTRL